MAAPDFHFVGMAGESGSNESMTEPESILPALQVGADSEAGSGDTTPMEQDPESEGESDDFSRKVASCLGRPVGARLNHLQRFHCTNVHLYSLRPYLYGAHVHPGSTLTIIFTNKTCVIWYKNYIIIFVFRKSF